MGFSVIYQNLKRYGKTQWYSVLWSAARNAENSLILNGIIQLQKALQHNNKPFSLFIASSSMTESIHMTKKNMITGINHIIAIILSNTHSPHKCINLKNLWFRPFSPLWGFLFVHIEPVYVCTKTMIIIPFPGLSDHINEII